ncbi:MAG: hypothetical protein ABSG16_20870 [Candidatus Acidiferrum sp.]
MRLKFFLIAALLLPLCAALPGSAAAQNPDTMLPEDSAAKAREILAQLVDALGGDSYTEVRDRVCEGRRANIGHGGELDGYILFKDYWLYPDKHRIDYSKKGNIIDSFSGDEGWTMDRSGVSEEPAPSVADFQDAVKRNVDNILRVYLKDKDLNLRYGGMDLVDNHQVDWVEFSDPQAERTQRLAIEHLSHLLVRSVITTVNHEYNQHTSESTIYTNYQRLGGVMTPLQVSRERDGRRSYQAFYASCTYNTGLTPDFFGKAALEKRYAEVGDKKDKDKYKNSRE